MTCWFCVFQVSKTEQGDMVSTRYALPLLSTVEAAWDHLLGVGTRPAAETT